MRLAYLFSRYPVLSQTFCDNEMLELERNGFSLLIGAVRPPHTSLRHAYTSNLHARVSYAPPQQILPMWEEKARAEGHWPDAIIKAHERKYGARSRPALRARNASYFADLFQRNAIEHFHVHFANRAAHTALFLKEISGIPFSLTAHGQDFIIDLDKDLLREVCEAAEFIAVASEYSRGLLTQRCPEAAGKIHRVYNGLHLTRFPTTVPVTASAKRVRYLGVGRLVGFKGFHHLLEACAELKRRGLDFSCEIIGDGPLREDLETTITELGIGTAVSLSGALPQEQVLARMQACDVFVLPSDIDRAGASDIFPTVLLEAMAAGRPVVAGQLAGIPEAIVHDETGVLFPPGDVAALATAMENYAHQPELRARHGLAGRTRVEERFQIETTARPLVELFKTLGGVAGKVSQTPVQISQVKQIGYLIENWPDDRLPSLERELSEMHRRNIAVTAFVCQCPLDPRLTRQRKQIATSLEYLPDAMVIEAEWEANRDFVRRLEEDRRYEEHRSPTEIFLQQARFALVLRRLIIEKEISHLHATSSRALLCGVMLRRMLGITLSATIEPRPDLSREVIQSALTHCVGGRTSDRKLSARLSSAFLLERAASDNFSGRLLSRLKDATGIGLTGRASFWQEWSELLVRWSRQET